MNWQGELIQHLPTKLYASDYINHVLLPIKFPFIPCFLVCNFLSVYLPPDLYVQDAMLSKILKMSSCWMYHSPKTNLDTLHESYVLATTSLNYHLISPSKLKIGIILVFCPESISVAYLARLISFSSFS